MVLRRKTGNLNGVSDKGSYITIYFYLVLKYPNPRIRAGTQFKTI